MFSVPGLVTFHFKHLVISLKNSIKTYIFDCHFTCTPLQPQGKPWEKCTTHKDAGDLKAVQLQLCLFVQRSGSWEGNPSVSGNQNVKHSWSLFRFRVQYQSQFGMIVVISLATQKVKSLFQNKAFKVKTFQFTAAQKALQQWWSSLCDSLPPPPCLGKSEISSVKNSHLTWL